MKLYMFRTVPLSIIRRNVKFVNAKQEKEIYQYRNTDEKLYKTNVAVWYNKIRR